MLLGDERQSIVEYSRRMRSDGLVAGTSGNISVRVGGLVAVTPSGIDYDELTPDSICVLDLDGRVVEATHAPSSELPLHLAVLRRGLESAVVHTHSPYATVLSTLVDAIPPIHYLLAELGGPVRVAGYATFGTVRLAQNVVRALDGRAGALLANHGAITIGSTIGEAYSRSVGLEWIAALFYRALVIGEPRLLPAGEIERVAERLERRAAFAAEATAD